MVCLKRVLQACLLTLTSTPLLRAASIHPLHAADPNRTVSHELFTSLEELARLVDVSYCVGGPGIQKPFDCLSHCKDLPGFELITTWDTGPFFSDSSGYIAFSHGPGPGAKRIIVAFRGTYSLANTVVDLSAYPQAYEPYGDDEDDGAGACANCTVHAGFMASWRNARRTVLYHVSAARARYPEYRVEVVGHSLGGAVAALAGVEMQRCGWTPRVTTFGEPKVGNSGFARFVDAVFELGGDGGDGERRFRRVTHVGDPVPLLPLREWGYAMHAGEVFVSKAELAPEVADVVLCEGDRDVRCISGAEDALTERLLGRTDVVGPVRSGLRRRDQKVLSDALRMDGDEVRQSRIGLPWHLVPAKYRLWELFFAHRDYFLRLGLCVPGGDPTG
ncbi:Alpha/Beta hydrolase protein [Aspergillus ambiguus]|uniref:lipase family protein n=1 Tax=Aspergillus ambiguus TaxID=176160 RepID=UPI003CCD0B57